MGKIGAKSAAFINHKPFHPGNLQNLEAVWIAEQKAKDLEKRQAAMQDRRKQEVQIEELRRALRLKERESQSILATPTGSAVLTSGEGKGRAASSSHQVGEAASTASKIPRPKKRTAGQMSSHSANSADGNHKLADASQQQPQQSSSSKKKKNNNKGAGGGESRGLSDFLSQLRDNGQLDSGQSRM